MTSGFYRLPLEAAARAAYRFSPLRALGERMEFRMNRPVFSVPSPEDLRALWSVQPGSIAVDERLRFRAGGDFLIFINTFNRAAACERAVRALQEAVRLAGVEPLVVVLDDCSRQDYGGVSRALEAIWRGQYISLRAKENLGKQRFWETYATAFALARSWPGVPALFLQDDIEFAPDFLKQARAMLASLNDPKVAVLNLFACADDKQNGQWLMFRRQPLPEKGVNLVQWFDLQCYLAHGRFFETMDYRMFPVSAYRWASRPSLSSGVGRQLTLRLWGRGNVYQVMTPLAFHGGEASLMNPEARARRSLDNRHLAAGPEPVQRKKA